jgi:hypothetical protein
MDPKREALIAACKAAIPCLKDWIRSTGYGEVHMRDSLALELIEKALRLNGEEV